MPVANYRAPKKLSPGSRVAIVAPSSPFPKDDFERGVARLRERYEVRYSEAIFAVRGYLAGEDERRASELEEAVRDPDVDAIIAARGGYGATRLLPRLDVALVQAHPKVFVGFSDVTALHALWQRAGFRSLHAHMVAALGRAPEALVPRYFAALEGTPPPTIGGLTTIRGGRAEGPLLGGNLAVLAALLGTPYAPSIDGAILFIEDIGERPFRVDRVLTTLTQSGWLDRVAGVAVGAFTDCTPGAEGWTIEEVLTERLGRTKVPVVLGVPSGHVRDNLELPLGAPATLDADAGELVVHEGAFE
jgi:muramoyltetrapeptide carboxypeptidase